MLKNRMHSTLARYALSLDTQTDIFARKWRPQLLDLLQRLPAQTERCMHQELELLDHVQIHINQVEARIREQVKLSPSMQLIQSVPGPAEILSIVIDREVVSITVSRRPTTSPATPVSSPRSRPAAAKPTTAR